MAEASEAMVGDQALFYRPDNFPMLSLEEPKVRQVEGVAGDQSRTNLANTPCMTALSLKIRLVGLGRKFQEVIRFLMRGYLWVVALDAR